MRILVKEDEHRIAGSIKKGLEQERHVIDVAHDGLSGFDLDAELLNKANRQITLALIVVDGVNFLISGGLGYFLAGKTLRPIKEMVDEQNR